MSRNFIDLEREMIDDLERRTGRSLSDWMAMIDAAGLHGKNAVIDWLRPQGFTFANASWLERIHNNSGRPIYLHQPETTRQRTPQTATPRPPSLPPATLAAVVLTVTWVGEAVGPAVALLAAGLVLLLVAGGVLVLRRRRTVTPLPTTGA